MALGLLGRKVGMTRVFAEDGTSSPVTVLDVSSNRISQIKSDETDGYCAVQVAFGKRRPGRVVKAMAGHFAKAGIEAGTVVKEFRVAAGQVGERKPGDALGAELFQVGQHVDVTGTSIGKGFAGVIKRHNFSSNRATHGNSVSHNRPGSTGQNQDPGRVFPGKRMAGHLGSVRTTVQNLEIVRIDEQRQLLMVKGAVPGSKGGSVLVRPSAKAGA
jgi:large subunit ribosomal protein L3